MSVAAAVGLVDGTASVGLAVGAVVAAAITTVRVIPESHRGVVRRWGRTSRVVGPGPVLLLPGVERITRVRVTPVRIDPLVVSATTMDGVEVRLEGSALCRITDPCTAARAVPDAFTAAAERIEHALRRAIAALDLQGLLDTRLGLGDALKRQLGSGELSGMEVLEVEVDDIEVRLSGSARLLP
jgi:regulator of protease activity HflC (stomatin/prohibitin superfamily)